LNTNSVKAKVKKGEVVVGSILNIPSARLAELAALCGFDYVVIDQEHGPIGIDVVEDMVRAVELHNVVPIVRVPSLQSNLILQALDAGAMGLHIPNVNTADDARKAVRFSKYAPARAWTYSKKNRCLPVIPSWRLRARSLPPTLQAPR
jgi:4-hydroxy-2-oxoheptanedioate aldolase